ncbi:hypothetical protein [Paraburkholderia caballeronis]|uniref:hypothetical protein n=1 Tax=Paraburkholderia caballeronis TaxID=416943 RepID=UPI001066D2E4|nr:hypothetical protein [Paraburkholderia caballeronis]TDV01998.1 hypothetical protein C7408_1456 [Paraburkholderia caballeronis]TDV06717.1 hypothetical protein C7406_1436 [Paraburkholderia caballeronis]TDV16140.1 hypothetical protein C7404_1446 [Paraburkholderia caballeronis]
MKLLLKYPLLVLLSLAFVVVVIPYGVCSNLFTGKRRLGNGTQVDSYFQMSPRHAGKWWAHATKRCGEIHSA